MEISLNGHFLVGYDFFQIICLLPKNKNVVQLRKVVIVLSAAIKQGILEKTVGASFIALWFVLSSLFL